MREGLAARLPQWLWGALCSLWAMGQLLATWASPAWQLMPSDCVNQRQQRESASHQESPSLVIYCGSNTITFVIFYWLEESH